MRNKTKKRDYVRSSDGKFAVVRGSSSKSNSRPKKTSGKGATASNTRPRRAVGPSVTPRKRSQRAIAKEVANGRGNNKIGKVSNRAIRRERNQQAIDALRALGNKIPKGSIKVAGQLRKGESVKLANGTILKRSKDNKYSIVKPRRKAVVRKG